MSWKNLILVLALLGLVSSVATGQELLDGTWIRMRVTGKGHRPEDRANGPQRLFATKCFMRLTYIVPSSPFDAPYYYGRTLCESERPGHYGGSSEINFGLFQTDGGAVSLNPQSETRFTNARGQAVWGPGVHFLFPVVREGVLRQVKLSGSGVISGGDLWGSYKITGMAVPEAKVPPSVRAALR